MVFDLVDWRGNKAQSQNRNLTITHSSQSEITISYPVLTDSMGFASNSLMALIGDIKDDTDLESIEISAVNVNTQLVLYHESWDLSTQVVTLWDFENDGNVFFPLNQGVGDCEMVTLIFDNE